MRDVAVCTYIDNNPNQITEFGWLYKSWLISSSWLTSRLVAFYNPDVDMNLLPRDTDIIYVPLVPYTMRDTSWLEYPYINSVEFLTNSKASFLTNFTYVLRTDNDCFLTSNFPKLRPRLATFGIGLYAQGPGVATRLSQVAERWSILPCHNNIGSTFMVHSHLALQYAYLQLEYCHKLRLEEFTNGYGTWPGWFFGVLSMYAGNLAANALFGMGLTLGGLDVHSMSQDRMCSTDYHIHAWHTYEYFSKFKWRDGEYKDIKLEDLDTNKISDYCLWIAGPGP